jgi:hypothetical protein
VDAVPTPARSEGWRKLGRTAAWCVAFLALFELLTAVSFAHPRLARSSIRTFLWYGASYESKLRELVNTPDLPPRSILYAGWINPELYRKEPSDAELTIYGMSFAANTGHALRELRPDMSIRMVGGPGAPLSHTYGAYLVDRPLRKTRIAIVGATSGAVHEVLLMNRGSLYTDAPFPYFFPRFEVVDGRVEKTVDPLINSWEELRDALNDGTRWEAQLDAMAEHDHGYRRFLFASDVLDKSLVGRLVRRGLSKHHAQQYSSKVLGARGFDQEHPAPQLFRALLRQIVRDLRAEDVTPVIVLYALQGQSNHLYDLVSDILREDKVAYVNSFDFCRSDSIANYLPDMHFVPDCDRAFAKRILELVDASAAAPVAL